MNRKENPLMIPKSLNQVLSGEINIRRDWLESLRRRYQSASFYQQLDGRGRRSPLARSSSGDYDRKEIKR